jgi:hypothetical protein
MLTARFGHLFSLPTRRLRGRALAPNRWQDLLWVARWRVEKTKRSLAKIFGSAVDSVGRNYGREHVFLQSKEGRSRMNQTVDVLRQRGILKGNSGFMVETAQSENRLGRVLLTLGYAFGR